MKPKQKVGILISGQGSNMLALIKAAKAPDYPAEITLVISSNPNAKGIELAKSNGIPVIVINHKNYEQRETFDQAITDAFKQANVDLVCNAGFKRLHSRQFVETWHNKQLNIHPSLLPALKGLNTHERALEVDLKITGCTVHFVRFDMDTGPIIAQAAVAISQDDTPESLNKRVLTAEHQLYPAALRQVASGSIEITGERTRSKQAHNPEITLFSPPIV